MSEIAFSPLSPASGGEQKGVRARASKTKTLLALIM
jgi:hypothetical protein